MAKYLGRTKKGEYTQTDVRKAAMRTYWHNVQDMVRWCSCFPPQIFDHRFCFDNEVEREYWKVMLKHDYYKDARMMQDKRKERMQNRKGCEFVGILQNPIVIDYLKHHKYHSHRLYDTHINWGVRNHWAKNEKDERILQIFIKHEKNRKERIEEIRKGLVKDIEDCYTPKQIEVIDYRLNEIAYSCNLSLDDLDYYCSANSTEMFSVIFDYKPFDKQNFEVD